MPKYRKDDDRKAVNITRIAQSTEQPDPGNWQDRELFSISDAADWIGGDMTSKGVRRLIRKGELRAIQFGGRNSHHYIPLSELNAYADRRWPGHRQQIADWMVCGFPPEAEREAKRLLAELEKRQRERQNQQQ